MRIRPNREFFNIELEEAFGYLCDPAKLTDEVIINAPDEVQENPERKFKFKEKYHTRPVVLEERQQLNETTIEYVLNFIDKSAKLWSDANLESKRALQKLLFPNGLHIDLKAKKCRTEDLSPLYSVICNKKEPNGSNSDDMVNQVD